MEYIIIYIATVIVTNILEKIKANKIFKDIADNGYKININKYNDLNNSMDDSGRKIDNLILFIPFVNVCSSIYTYMHYINNRESYFNMLKISGAVEKMNKEESYIYEISKKGQTAITISLATKEEIDSLYQDARKMEESKILETVTVRIKKKKIKMEDLILSVMDYYKEKYPDKKEATEHMKNASPKEIMYILNDLCEDSDNVEYIYVDDEEEDEYITEEVENEPKSEYTSNNEIENEKGFSKVKKR